MVRSFVLVAALLLTMAGCSLTCAAPPPEPPTEDAVGVIDVGVDGTTATLSLSGLRAPLRALQVDVVISGGRASAATGTGPWDVVEAGLAPSAANPDGGPRDRFTLVVADTRRLPVNDGGLARLVIDDGANVTLSNAFAVDATGVRRPLTVGGR